MRKLLIPLLAALALPTAVMADLGGADLPNAGSFSTSNKVYDAWCGEFPITIKPPKGVDCKVQFKEGRLIVDNGKGVTTDQISDVKLEYRCKSNVFLTSCKSRRDKRYRFNYIDSKGTNKTALITFRHHDTDQLFRTDLEVWLGKPLKEGIEVEIK